MWFLWKKILPEGVHILERFVYLTTNLFYYYNYNYFTIIIAFMILFSIKIERLRNDVELLRLECNKLNLQVDTATGNQGSLIYI